MPTRSTIIVLISIPCLLIGAVLCIRKLPIRPPRAAISSNITAANPAISGMPTPKPFAADPRTKLSEIGHKISFGACQPFAPDTSGILSSSHILWISNHELLGWSFAGPDHFGRISFSRVDIITGKAIPLTKLTNRIGKLLSRRSEAALVSPIVSYNTSLSPDGKWLLVVGYELSSIKPNGPRENFVDRNHGPYGRDFAISLDGRQVVKLTSKMDHNTLYPYGFPQVIPITWLSDNRHWMEMDWSIKNHNAQGTFYIHDREHPEWSQPIYSMEIPRSNTDTSPQLIGMANGHTIIVDDTCVPSRQFRELNPETGIVINTPMPDVPCSALSDSQIAIAPNGRKIAMIRDAAASNVSGSISSDHVEQVSKGIWVRDPDGENEILAAWTTAPANSNIPEVFWTPDSKHLLVWDQSGSWLVPVKG